MAYATDRRASSPKRDNDILKTKWPAITKTAYDQTFAKGDEMDPKLRSLCQSRLKLGQALTTLGVAMKKYNPQVNGDGRHYPVWQALRALSVQLEKLYLKFPLEIK